MPIFEAKSDQEFREKILSLYYETTNNKQSSESIYVKIPIDIWVSAYSLNLLLTFIEAIKLFASQSRIFVEIITPDIAEELLKSNYVSFSSELISNITSKLRFIESMKLIDHLRDRGVIVRPSRETIDLIQDKLEAHKAKGKFLYSSRMLSLSPLVETQEEQFALTTRIRTLTSILNQNLWGRLDHDSIDQASKQIMFELVKNVYQHSNLPEKYSSLARGFACAQINSYPTIRSKKYETELIRAVLEQIKRPIRNKRMAWLSITINDFGIGLTKAVSVSLKERLDRYDSLKIGRYHVTKDTLNNEALLIEIAISTDFSAKMLRLSSDKCEGKREIQEGESEKWEGENETFLLANRGYGLIYCVGFIARTFGRMRIRSGSTELDIFPKAEAVLNQEVWSNVVRAEQELEENFPFEIVRKMLDATQRSFPGTQILIEIPVWKSFGKPTQCEEEYE